MLTGVNIGHIISEFIVCKCVWCLFVQGLSGWCAGWWYVVIRGTANLFTRNDYTCNTRTKWWRRIIAWRQSINKATCDMCARSADVFRFLMYFMFVWDEYVFRLGYVMAFPASNIASLDQSVHHPSVTHRFVFLSLSLTLMHNARMCVCLCL